MALVSSGDPEARSGLARNFAQLIAGLRDLGHDVMRVLGDDTPPTGPDAANAALARMRRQAGDCHRAFSEWKPQVVHIELAGGFGHAALEAALALRLPITSYWHRLHETVPEDSREPLRQQLLAFHRRVARTFVDAEDDADELRRQGVPGVVLAGRGVDTRRFRPEARSRELRQRWGAGDSDAVLLHVGRLIALKNLDLLVRAAEVARAAAPAMRLVIVGDGPERPELESRLPWAVFTGSLDDEALAEAYASCEAFLFPSRVDSFGNVVLEAMASGLAVVAFDRGAARRLSDGVDGHRIPLDGSGDQAFIASAAALARDPARARALGATARQTAAKSSLAAAAAVVANELRVVVARA